MSEWALVEAARSNPRGVFRVAAAEAGPVFGEIFAMATASDVVEYVPDLDAVAQLVKEQVVAGGRFVFFVPTLSG